MAAAKDGGFPVDPLHQFEIRTLIQIGEGDLLSFTNSSLWMLITVAAVSLFFSLGSLRARIVPSRLQSCNEILYEMISRMVRENVGSEGRRWFPFIFTLFLLLLFGNLLGLIPGSFTFTSHLAVTFALAATIFVGVTIIGFVYHGLGYFRILFPEGAPLWTAVILVPIELISYLSRPISLSMRLFANMMAGHILLKVFAGFIILMGVAGILPLAVLIGITALEFLVAVLQAYIFTILTCVYLHDAIHLH